MNILVVTAMFPPIRTGTSFYSRNLANELLKRGHNVEVVTTRNKNADVDNYTFKVHHLPALHIPLKNYFKHLRFCSFFLGNFYRLPKIAKTFNADAIILVNHYLDIAFPAIAASKINGIPLVCSVGTQMQSLNPVRNKILNILDRLICGKLIFPFCRKIISWDSEIERYLKDIHGPAILNKSVIVPYGVNGDIKSFIEHTQDYSICNQILGVGAVIEQRNFLFLIRVFKKITDFMPGIRLKIIGHVYYDAAVRLAEKLKIADRVTFTGELTHREVLNELKQSTLYWGAATGKYYGLGTATIEAMLMGVPVVSNVPADLFGKPLLHDMSNFIHTDGISLEPTVSKIKTGLSDVQLRRKLGENGKDFVCKFLNWDSVARQMETVLQETIRGSNQQ